MGIEVYSKTSCSNCDKAKQLLKVHGKDYLEYKLDEDFSREILLSKFPEAKTFPVIVIDGMNIGGYDQLIQHLNEEANDHRKLLLENGN